MELQLDFFEDVDSVEFFKKELITIVKSQDNLRRGLFARHGDLCKMIMGLREEVEGLKLEIDNLKNRHI